MVTKPVVGGSADAWGTINNAALDALELEISGAGDITGAKTVTGDGEIILAFTDTATANQSIYGAATTTGKTAAVGDAVIKVEASQEAFINDVTHDWNVGLLLFNWTADAAALSVGNMASGDGIFIAAYDTAHAAAFPPNALNIFAGSPSITASGTETGTATATGATTLTDSTKTWPVNQWQSRWIVTPNLSNPATARRAYITANTATVITHTGWKVTNATTTGQVATSTPSGTTAYVIPPADGTGILVNRFSSGRGIFITGATNSGNAGTNDELLFLDDYSMTAGTLLNMRHTDTAFTGDGIKMDFGRGTGSHTGNFMSFWKNGALKAYINDDGAFSARGDATGAPTTGAHVSGEAVTTKDGHIWVCSANGTPGTWRDLG